MSNLTNSNLNSRPVLPIQIKSNAILPGPQIPDNQLLNSNVVSSTLSPPILVNINDFKSFLTSTTNLSNASSSATTTATSSSLTATNSSENKLLKLGDYLFFEPTSNNDSFSSGLNTKTKKFFYWKKFNLRDYMKKLQAYLIMDSCTDLIYKFENILFEKNYLNGTDQHLMPNYNNVYVIFEPHHGDLHSYMKEKKRLEEPEAKHIFRQCVEAVNSCHENGIIVRDIKLKKFVFIDKERTKVALANLEDCLVLDDDADNDLIKSQQGCPAYVSPEVLNPLQTSYSGRLSDSWSLGIILFTLLIGRYPFHHPTIANMFARISRGKFQVPPSTGISLEAKLLLRALIRVKPEERLLPLEILAHSWLRKTDQDNHHNYLNLQHQFNEAKFSYLANTKTQLGISISAPASFNSSSNNSANHSLNFMNNIRRENRAQSFNSKDNDDDDRLVPVFDATSTNSAASSTKNN